MFMVLLFRGPSHEHFTFQQSEVEEQLRLELKVLPRVPTKNGTVKENKDSKLKMYGTQ